MLSLHTLILTGLTISTLQAAPQPPANHQNSPSKQHAWIQLFDGKTLNGWTPKFTGHQAGTNYKNTFRVEDGKLCVNYSQYQSWQHQYGHLFYKTPYSHYTLRCEYRFLEPQLENGPGWAYRNNGIMIHSQPPHTMTLNQEFPTSIEVQLLGGLKNHKRPTLGVCTPGTHIKLQGKLSKKHVHLSNAPTFPGNQWVQVEVVVKGNSLIQHKINGKVVMEYSHPQHNDGTPLQQGYIAIQSESHPTEFRKIELKPHHTP